MRFILQKLKACAPHPAHPARALLAKASRTLNWQTLAWTFIIFAVAVRSVQYLSNRSLWIDEATLALNIIERSFSGLFLPLANNQAAPVGFLLIERVAIQLFGDSEYSLRLFPFVCGTGSILLFYTLARSCLSVKATAVAVALFAVSDNLIYFSSEVKQYSSDVLVAILLSLVGVCTLGREITQRRALLLAVAGGTAIWFSHPSVFVLSGVGATLMLFALRGRQWKRAATLGSVGVFWIACFAASYFVSLKGIGSNDYLEEVWGGRRSFMPLPPTSLSDLQWFTLTFFRVFNNGLRASFPLLAAAVFLAGAFSMIRKRKRELLLVISPAVFALLASGLHQYPFARRLLLFLVPALILYIAEGAEYIGKLKPPYTAVGALAVASLLIVGPLIAASLLFVHPTTREEIRPAIEYVENRRQPGDILYLYYGSIPAFDYYKSKFAIAEADYIVGIAARDDWENQSNQTYVADLEKLLGNNRVWVLFSHVRSFKGVNEGVFFLKYLDSNGQRLDEFLVDGASAYLYDLSR